MDSYDMDKAKCLVMLINERKAQLFVLFFFI